MDCDAHLVTDLDPSEVHEGGIEHQPMRVPDLGDGLGHLVKLCFTALGFNPLAFDQRMGWAVPEIPCHVASPLRRKGLEPGLRG